MSHPAAAALEQRVPGASAHAADDHEGHESSFEEIEQLIRAIEQADLPQRELAGRRLYRRYAVFAAHDLEHMNVEETELLTALHDAFTDEELKAIEGRIIAWAYLGAGFSLRIGTTDLGEIRANLPSWRSAIAPAEGLPLRLGWAAEAAVPVAEDLA